MMGLPNVGKSAVFNRFTGLDAMVSNYSGTTVSYAEGTFDIEGETVLLRDAPGIYNIKHPNDEAERVAEKMLDDRPDAVLFVLDALNLESSLNLLLQVMEAGIPTVVALNRTDLMRSRGIKIDHVRLQRALGVPVVPTVALSGDSLDLVRYALSRELGKTIEAVDKKDDAARWERVESIKRATLKALPESNGRMDFLIRPFPGIPIALGVLVLLFAFVIGVGMGLRQYLLLPLFEGGQLFGGLIPFTIPGLFPFIERSVEALTDHAGLQGVLIGEYGFLIKGIEWPFALVLPYVITFYTGISILEDVGYLPRVAVLLDGVLKKIGLNGSSIIPMLLGYGCGIPAIMSTRTLQSRKQRIMVATIVSLAIPCVAQMGAFISLLAERSLLAFIGIFLVSIVAIVLAGLVMDRYQKQKTPFTLMEIPPLLAPKPSILSKKVLFRIKHFVRDGAMPMVIAIAAAALLYELGTLEAAGRALSPVVTGWLNLPEEASTPLLMGIVRRELTVLPFIDMADMLSTAQFFTAALVALFYVPCIAMIATLSKEFSIRTAAGILLLTTFTAFLVGGLFAQLHALLSMTL